MLFTEPQLTRLYLFTNVTFSGKKANELRKDYLQRISDLKSEAKDLETNFNEKNKRYESIQAYSKVSSIEVC